MKKFREFIDSIEEMDRIDEILIEDETELQEDEDSSENVLDQRNIEELEADPYTAPSYVVTELLAGIVLIGVVEALAGVWFVKDQLGYELGILIGTVMAAAMAVHMAWSLDKALDMGREDAEKKIRMNSMTRYFSIVFIMGGLMYFKIGNPLAAFLGLMSLKVAAYLQPFTHKCMQKFYHL